MIRAAIISAATAPGVPSGESESLKRRAAQAFKDLSRGEEPQPQPQPQRQHDEEEEEEQQQ